MTIQESNQDSNHSVGTKVFQVYSLCKQKLNRETIYISKNEGKKGRREGAAYLEVEEREGGREGGKGF